MKSYISKTALCALLISVVTSASAFSYPAPCRFPAESLRFFDLSYSVSENTIFFPGSRNFTLNRDKEGDQGGIWYSSFSFCMGEHGGTHLDAPFHFSRTGHTVDQIPMERLVNVRAEVIDVSDHVFDNRYGNVKNAGYALRVADLLEYEEKYGRIPDGAVILLYTGWSGFYPDRQKYLGIQDGDEGNLRFPGCSEAAIKWLVEERKIYGFGLDTPSVDIGKSKTYPFHVYAASKDIYNLENVANLHLVKPYKGSDGVMRKRPLRLIVAPMKIVGGTGGPCRILAFEDNSY